MGTSFGGAVVKLVWEREKLRRSQSTVRYLLMF